MATSSCSCWRAMRTWGRMRESCSCSVWLTRFWQTTLRPCARTSGRHTLWRHHTRTNSKKQLCFTHLAHTWQSCVLSSSAFSATQWSPCPPTRAWLAGCPTVTPCMPSSETTERRKRFCSTLNIASCSGWGTASISTVWISDNSFRMFSLQLCAYLRCLIPLVTFSAS